jgi:hypothetical protein
MLYGSLLSVARQAVAGADRAKEFGGELLLGLGAGVEQMLVVVEYAVGEIVVAEVRPEALHGLRSGLYGGRKRIQMFLGVLSFRALCHPA